MQPQGVAKPGGLLSFARGRLKQIICFFVGSHAPPPPPQLYICSTATVLKAHLTAQNMQELVEGESLGSFIT